MKPACSATPTSEVAPSLGGPTMGWRWFVFLASAFILFFQLGGRGLNEPDEGRYAEVGREMLVSGDYITPQLNGLPHYTKPPLTYWLIAISLKLFGVNEFGARLPSALAAMGSLFAVFLTSRRAMGEIGALWSAVILTSSLLFISVARLITADMLLCCWVSWSVWALWRWSENSERNWKFPAWFFVFLGLGLITKGPIAVVLPLFALIGLRWKNPRLQLRHLNWGRGILITLAIALPWFLVVTWGKPEMWDYFVGRETVGRLLTNVHGRAKPWWYFAPVLVCGLLPWSNWLVVTFMMRRTWSPEEIKFVRLCITWVGGGFLLFTVSQSKLPTYGLPLMPPLAMLVALTLIRLSALVDADKWRPTAIAFLSGSWLTLLGIAVFVTVRTVRDYDLPLSQSLVPISLVLITAFGTFLTFRLKGFLAAFGTLAATTFALSISVVSLLPHFERHFGAKTTAKFVALRVSEADPEKIATLVVASEKLRYGL
ncbi:MAG: glycosyltransferase family 39 protein, partial [Verrucomicrobiales bacterium]